jgi:ADP-ribose pyrophosphatase YjhB (NUDIX family)
MSRVKLFKNPIPVGVAIIPVGICNQILAIRRIISPGTGLLALPGGYVNDGETVQEATSREVNEELGLDTKPDEFKKFCYYENPQRDRILFFHVYNRCINHKELTNFTPNNEASEYKIIRHPPPDLAFPLHDEAVRDYLRSVNYGHKHGMGIVDVEAYLNLGRKGWPPINEGMRDTTCYGQFFNRAVKKLTPYTTRL